MLFYHFTLQDQSSSEQKRKAEKRLSPYYALGDKGIDLDEALQMRPPGVPDTAAIASTCPIFLPLFTVFDNLYYRHKK
jgi:hypothetical protein